MKIKVNGWNKCRRCLFQTSERLKVGMGVTEVSTECGIGITLIKSVGMQCANHCDILINSFPFIFAY